MTIDQVLATASDKMTKSIAAVEHQFTGVRTTKASPALVENVEVEAYGNMMKVKEVATITTPEPRVLLLQPWDAGTLKALEKGILKSNLGITPAVSGKAIRLVMPELSQERRQELVKMVSKYAEDGRIAIRQIRREAIEALKALKKDSKITEDDLANAEKKAQKLTDDFIAKVGERAAEKEKEIMKV
jgi:ribosome recycling factor